MEKPKQYGAPRPRFYNRLPGIMRFWNVAKNGWAMFGKNLAFEPPGITAIGKRRMAPIRWLSRGLCFVVVLLGVVLEIFCDWATVRRMKKNNEGRLYRF